MKNGGDGPSRPPFALLDQRSRPARHDAQPQGEFQAPRNYLPITALFPPPRLTILTHPPPLLQVFFDVSGRRRQRGDRVGRGALEWHSLTLRWLCRLWATALTPSAWFTPTAGVRGWVMRAGAAAAAACHRRALHCGRPLALTACCSMAGAPAVISNVTQPQHRLAAGSCTCQPIGHDGANRPRPPAPSHCAACRLHPSGPHCDGAARRRDAQDCGGQWEGDAEQEWEAVRRFAVGAVLPASPVCPRAPPPVASSHIPSRPGCLQHTAERLASVGVLRWHLAGMPPPSARPHPVCCRTSAACAPARRAPAAAASPSTSRAPPSTASSPTSCEPPVVVENDENVRSSVMYARRCWGGDFARGNGARDASHTQPWQFLAGNS